jgi:3-phosphoshikimate 1-carboxyvinyltransferase
MIVSPGTYQGTIQISASKSDSQRAILCAGLADGISTILGIGNSADELAMLENIKTFGAKCTQTNEGYQIEGTPKFPEATQFHVGESGLGARLMTSLCLVKKGSFEIHGEGSLLQRPLSFFGKYFQNKVAQFSDQNGFLPITTTGGLKGDTYKVSGEQSSQYISGLLMALPLAKKDSHLFVKELNSKPYVQMTLNTLSEFGINIQHQELKEFIIPGNQKYLPTAYQVEGDWSSASYWLVASALGQKISVQGLSMFSLQADKAILQAFKAANCTIEMRMDRIFIDGTERVPFTFDATHSPDLFPALASLAALTEGTSTLYGLSRLMDKESNRALTLQTEFGKLGISIDLVEDENCMRIHGQKQLFGGRVFSNNDHRIAMSLAVLGLFSKNPIQVEHPEAVKKSYPGFWGDLEGLRG